MNQLHPTSARAVGRERLRRELRDGYRRSMRLTALGTLLPGAGLTRTRHRVVGWSFLALTAAAVALVAFALVTRGVMRTVLSVVSSPTALQYAAIGLLVVGALWAASIVLTAVSSRPTYLDRTRTRGLAIFTTLMVAVVGGSSYTAAEYALITKDTIVGVFPSEQLKPGEGAKVDVAAKDPWAETPRVNILLLGSDAGVGRIGTRTDSMIVASIDTKTGRTVLISLPRNLMRAPIPESSPLRAIYPKSYGLPYCQRGKNECMLNAIWAEADEYKAAHPEAYPGESSPGRYEIREVISSILGTKIDHTVIIDLKGFEQLIDAMGGIDINVRGGGPNGDRPLPYGKAYANGTYSYYFKPGMQHLNGYKALWYARTRHADDDFYRQARQRCVIKAIVNQVNPAQMLAQYTDIARIAKSNIYTDIPGQNLPAFVDLIERVQHSKIVSVALTEKQGIDPMDPNYKRIQSLFDKAIHPPTDTPTPKPTSTRTAPTPNISTQPQSPTPTNSAQADPDGC